MDKVWQIDDTTVIEASLGPIDQKVVKINGQEVYRSRDPAKEIAIALPDGRAATIVIKGEIVDGPDVDLRIGEWLLNERSTGPILCSKCGAAAKSFDRFCNKCGRPLDTPQDKEAGKRLRQATSAIWWLAVLFVVFGAIMYFVTKNQSEVALAKLAGADPASAYTLGTETLTVQELRARLEWEPIGVLAVNMVLAAIMAVLAWWGRKAPLAAVLVATATYVVVQVANALADPATLGQGLILKIIIIAILVKGIKAALALRTANA